MARFILGHRLGKWGESNARVERLLFRLDRTFFDLLFLLLRSVPVDTAVRVGGAIAATLAPRFRKNRAMRENLRIAFPEKTPAELDRLARECWSNAGALFAESAHLAEICADGDAPRLQIEVVGNIDAFTHGGKPAIFAASHQANWEMIGAAIVRIGVPLTCVYSPASNPLLEQMLLDWRRKVGCELVASDDNARPLMRALAAGRSLGIVMDRRVESGRAVRFFGHDKPSTIGPSRLALRFDCQLVPVRVERLEGARFRVSFLPPIERDVAITDETEQAVDMTRRVHALFEEWIRERPGQWFCSKRLWPKPVYQH